jgi:hypothetical protein
MMQEGPRLPSSSLKINPKGGEHSPYVRSQNLNGFWGGFTDSYAGVYEYEYAVVHNDGLTTIFPYTTLSAASTASTASLLQDQMRHALGVKFIVRGLNYALSPSKSLDAEIVFDLEPPLCRLGCVVLCLLYYIFYFAFASQTHIH